MTTHDHMLLALANFVACTGLGYAAVVRLSVMSRHTTALSWRLRYAGLFTAATLSGWSPILFGEWPGLTQALMTVAFLCVIGLGGGWADGVPWYARKDERKSA